MTHLDSDEFATNPLEKTGHEFRIEHVARALSARVSGHFSLKIADRSVCFVAAPPDAESRPKALIELAKFNDAIRELASFFGTRQSTRIFIVFADWLHAELEFHRESLESFLGYSIETHDWLLACKGLPQSALASDRKDVQIVRALAGLRLLEHGSRNPVHREAVEAGCIAFRENAERQFLGAQIRAQRLSSFLREFDSILAQSRRLLRSMRDVRSLDGVRTRVQRMNKLITAGRHLRHRATREFPYQREPADNLRIAAPLFQLTGTRHRASGCSDDGLTFMQGQVRLPFRSNRVEALDSAIALPSERVEYLPTSADLPKKTLLDVGCKSGGGLNQFFMNFAPELEVRPNEVDLAVGIDIDEVKLEGAQDSGVLPVLGDASNLPFCDSSFDVVLVMELLEHVPRETAVKICREARRVCRGLVFIQNPDFSSEDELAQLGLRFSWMGWTEHCHHIGPADLREILIEAGYEPSQVHVEQIMPVRSSDHPLIVPTSAPRQAQAYRPEFERKTHVAFDSPVYEKQRVILRCH